MNTRSPHKPETKSVKSPTRHRRLALPFVMTAAAACTPKPAEEPTAIPAEADQAEATPVVISNPPAPRPAETDPKTVTPVAEPSETVAPQEKPAIIMRNPPPPDSHNGRPDMTTHAPTIAPATPAKTDPPAALPDAPTTGGQVQVNPDGTCWWHASAPACPPQTACNPPAPKQVKCESEKVRRPRKKQP